MTPEEEAVKTLEANHIGLDDVTARAIRTLLDERKSLRKKTSNLAACRNCEEQAEKAESELAQAREEIERLKARTLPEREQSGLPHQPMMCEGQRFCASCRYPDQGAPNYTLVPWPCKAHLRDLCGRLADTVEEMYPLCVDEDKQLAEDDVAHRWLALLAEAREKEVGRCQVAGCERPRAAHSHFCSECRTKTGEPTA